MAGVGREGAILSTAFRHAFMIKTFFLRDEHKEDVVNFNNKSQIGLSLDSVLNHFHSALLYLFPVELQVCCYTLGLYALSSQRALKQSDERAAGELSERAGFR